jgi:hypothetical protein
VLNHAAYVIVPRWQRHGRPYVPATVVGLRRASPPRAARHKLKSVDQRDQSKNKLYKRDGGEDAPPKTPLRTQEQGRGVRPTTNQQIRDAIRPGYEPSAAIMPSSASGQRVSGGELAFFVAHVFGAPRRAKRSPVIVPKFAFPPRPHPKSLGGVLSALVRFSSMPAK